MPVAVELSRRDGLRRVEAQRGATLVEYVLVLTVVCVACAGALSFLGGAVGATMSRVAAQIAGGCGSGGSFQILIDGNSCPTAPWPLAATLGQRTSFQLSTVGTSGPVTYSCTDCSSFDLVSPDGLLQVLPGTGDGSFPMTLTATGAAGQSASYDLVVTVGPTSTVSSVALPASSQCTYVGGPVGTPMYLECASATWLDGYYLFTVAGWQLVVPGNTAGPGEVTDATALADGTFQEGSTGAPSGPWTCSQTAPDGTCMQFTTGASGPVGSPGAGALGTAG